MENKYLDQTGLETYGTLLKDHLQATYVRTVNHVAPDASGNVNATAGRLVQWYVTRDEYDADTTRVAPSVCYIVETDEHIYDDGLIHCTGISFNTDAISLEKGESFQLEVTLTPSNTTDTLTVVSMNRTIAQLDENLMVNWVASGETTIRATCGSVVVSIPVTCTGNPCVDMSLDSYSVTLNEGETHQIVPTLIPYDTTDEVTYLGLDDSIATVSSTGLISYVGVGTTGIAVQCGDVQKSLLVTCLGEPKIQVQVATSVGSNITIDGETYDSENPLELSEGDPKLNWIKSITNENE